MADTTCGHALTPATMHDQEITKITLAWDDFHISTVCILENGSTKSRPTL